MFTYEQTRQEVQKLFEDVNSYLKDRYAHRPFDNELVQSVEYYTDFISFDCSFRTRLWYILNDMKEMLKCVICGEPITYDVVYPYKKEYGHVICKSKSCQVARRQNAIRDKYGVDNIMDLREYRDKISVSNTKTREEQAVINQKRIDTCIERYGVVNGGSTPEANQKKRAAFDALTEEQKQERKALRARTTFERYGDENVMHIAEFQERAKQTNIEKYGVPHYFQSTAAHKHRRSRYQLDGYDFDSSYEILYYIWLRDTNQEFKLHPCSIPYLVGDMSKNYIPDFQVGDYLVECKGSHFFDAETGDLINPFTSDPDIQLEYKCKGQAMIDNNVLIVTDVSLQESFVTERYGKNYIDQFKVR